MALAHTVLLAWLNLQTPRTANPAEGPGVSVGLFDASALLGEAEASSAAPTAIVSPPSEPPPPEPPLQEMTPDDPFPALADPLEAPVASTTDVSFTADPVELGTALQPAAAAAPGGGARDTCRLEAQLRQALEADPTIRRAIAEIPTAQRSVSNAVMLWNGRWTLTEAGSSPIRSAVVAAIEAAPPACRNQPVSGPSLLFITGETKPTILVLGSGLWRWSDIVSEGGQGMALVRPGFP